MTFINFLILLVVAYFVLGMPKTIPSRHFAVPNFFDKRMKTFWDEGLVLTIPFVITLPKDQIYSKIVDPISVKFDFPTDDNVILTWTGLIEYVRDPEIQNNEGYPRITDFKRKQLKSQLKERLQEEVKNLGNVYESDDFRNEYGEALGLLLESVMRLKNIPHFNPKGAIKDLVDNNENENGSSAGNISKWGELKSDLNEKLQEKSKSKIKDWTTTIPVENRLEFYSVFSHFVKKLLASESENNNEWSENEKYYGIDIQKISNSDIGFTNEMKQALEEQEKSEKEIEGKAKYHNKAMEMAKQIKENSDKSISFNKAYDRALVILGKADQKNLSFDGVGDNSGVILEVNNNE